MVLYTSILISLDRTVEEKTGKITEKDNIKPDLRDTVVLVSQLNRLSISRYLF
jgi:hypothetical protein